MKKISEVNLNAIIASKEIDTVLEGTGETSNQKTVRLVKIVLRKSPTHKLQKSVPLYAFVKNAGKKVVARFIINGVVVILENSHISSLSEVKGNFSIGGITYGVKDTVNGYPRYKVKKSA